jgi:deoxyribonuclease-4
VILGAHESTAGGLATAFDRAEADGCDCFQIFTKNKGAWAARALSNDDIRSFRERAMSSRASPVIAHAAYLINIASPARAARRKSVAALRVEVERCEALGIPSLVLHPGSHLGAGEEAGLLLAAASLDEVHAATMGFRTKVLIETSAGQGSSICATFESIGRLLARVKRPERLGVCVDTCHVFAAGYDLRTDAGHAAATASLDREVGLERVLCIHANDSKRECGSRIDRHEHIGRGKLGREAFRRLLADPRLARVPFVIELPPEGGMIRKNLAALRTLARPRTGGAAKAPRGPEGGHFPRLPSRSREA